MAIVAELSDMALAPLLIANIDVVKDVSKLFGHFLLMTFFFLQYITIYFNFVLDQSKGYNMKLIITVSFTFINIFFNLPYSYTSSRLTAYMVM